MLAPAIGAVEARAIAVCPQVAPFARGVDEATQRPGAIDARGPSIHREVNGFTPLGGAVRVGVAERAHLPEGIAVHREAASGPVHAQVATFAR